MVEIKLKGVRFKGNSWTYRIKKTVNGKVITKEKSGFTTAQEAYDKRMEALEEFEITNHLCEDITMDILFRYFLECEGEDTRSYNTILRYKSLYKNHIQAEFGKAKIEKIRPIHINDFLKKKQEQYTSGYPRSMYNFLMVLFKYAYRMDYVKENVMDRVRPPKETGIKGVKLPETEKFIALQKRLESTNVQVAFNIGLGLGVRASECYALRWSDFDFEKNEVKISKQLQLQNGVWCFAGLKTSNSYRTIKFGKDFSKYLQSIKFIQDQNRLRLGEFYQSNKIKNTISKPEEIIEVTDFVNVKENGSMLTTNSNKVISRIAKEMGIEYNYHKLRHKYCSTLADHNVNPTMIKENAGHSKAEFTFNRYIHPSEGQREYAASVIDSEIPFEIKDISDKEEK